VLQSAAHLDRNAEKVRMLVPSDWLLTHRLLAEHFSLHGVTLVDFNQILPCETGVDGDIQKIFILPTKSSLHMRLVLPVRSGKKVPHLTIEGTFPNEKKGLNVGL
jgi:hypothetical protein